LKLRDLKKLNENEKASLILILINLIIWLFSYWKKLNMFEVIIGIIAILVAYVLVYLLVRSAIFSFAKKLLKETVNYLNKNEGMKYFEFSEHFHSALSREYIAIIFIGLLIIDGFALYKFHFSVLSIINYILTTGNTNE